MEQLLIQMLSKREQWLPHLLGHTEVEAFKHILEQGLQQVSLEAIQQADELLCREHLAQLFKLSRYASQNLSSSERDNPNTPDELNPSSM